MADSLLQEDGASRVLQEDGASAVLLETTGVSVPFIGSVTAIYTPAFGSTQTATVPFIASVTAVSALALHRSIHFVSSTINTPVALSNANTIVVPAGVADGDLLVAIFATSLSDVQHLAAAGWTQRTHVLVSNTGLAIYTKIASSEPGTYTFAGGTDQAGINACLAYRGVATEVPDAMASSSGGTAASLTPTQSDDLEIYIQAAASDTTGTLSTLAEWFGRVTAWDQFNGTGLFIMDRPDDPTGSATGSVAPSGSAGTNPVYAHLLFRRVQDTVEPSFIASTTTVYTPALQGTVDVPFIASHTVLYALLLPYVHLPFIASLTRVYGVFSLFTEIVGTGPGNGGEVTPVRLAPAGTSVTTTLAAPLMATGSLLELVSSAGLPTTQPFVVTIDDEQLYVVAIGGGAYRIRGRGLGNTTPAAHIAGASATWGDSYDMAIVAGLNIAASFTADITGSGSTTYPGWLICFDSSQAYLAGARYPMHVTEVVGVFDAGAGTVGTNRLDGAQPNAVSTPVGVSDDCPAALANPARISSNILAGDVAVVRYTNPEAAALDLGPRSTALQSWFGLKRVDFVTGADVSLTDPNGVVVDTTAGAGTFTGSVNGEWTPPVLGPGIAPDTGLPTNHDVPYTSVTLPGSDRNFTVTTEKGWPICCLAVRQGDRRIPFWESFDWHDYNYVYCGFGSDDTYAQLLVNRNGAVFGSVPSVALPGAQDISGPDAVWDNGSYYFGASWYVAIFGSPYLVLGPAIGGTAGPGTGTGPLPVVDFTGGVGSPSVIEPATSGPPPVEGGSGGDVPVPSGGRELFQIALV
jgi:hypothetical protein